MKFRLIIIASVIALALGMSYAVFVVQSGVYGEKIVGIWFCESHTGVIVFGDNGKGIYKRSKGSGELRFRWSEEEGKISIGKLSVDSGYEKMQIFANMPSNNNKLSLDLPIDGCSQFSR